MKCATRFLPFQLEIAKTIGGLGWLGLPTYLEFEQVIGLGRTVSRDVQARQRDQGRTDEQNVTSVVLVLLNPAGGDGIKDLVVLEGDEMIG